MSTLEEMFVYDNLAEDVHESIILQGVLDTLEDSNIDIDDIIQNKRRITMKEFYIFNEQLTKWHVDGKYSIIDVIVALSNYSYSIHDLLTILTSENMLVLRESLASKYNKKIVTVTDMSDFFE